VFNREREGRRRGKESDGSEITLTHMGYNHGGAITAYKTTTSNQNPYGIGSITLHYNFGFISSYKKT